MTHREINLIHSGKLAFDIGMTLAFAEQEANPNKEPVCNGYFPKGNTLILSHYSEKCSKFLYPLNKRQTIEFVWGWLQLVKPTEKEPDTDGSTKVGFEITTKGTGIGSDEWGTFIAVRPVWLVYGK